MPLMSWNEKLSIKVPSVDRQHKVIIKHINELNDAIQEGNSKGVCRLILRSLSNYTRVHFAYEEMLFKRYDYPTKQEHLAVHERLLGKVVKYKDRFDKGETDIGEELLEFLQEWLYHHILEDDMAYSDFMVERGVE